MDKRYSITCPYCFKTFNDDQVHFRMGTVLTEEEFDVPPDEDHRHYSLDEIMKDPRLTDSERKKRYNQFALRQEFAAKDDDKYEAFWKRFHGTTEEKSDGVSDVPPFQRPVFDSNDSGQRKFFDPSGALEIYEGGDADGFVYGAVDCFGNETRSRVCPFCHNPLPGDYGRYPVKFISIIGITGAGKTVFLSQLCRCIEEQLGYFNISVAPTSNYANRYMRENPVEMGKPLPAGTEPQSLLQPLCYDLTYRLRGNDGAYVTHKQTLVFYDIAGENCMPSAGGSLSAAAKEFGPFIEHSNGIILVIQPDQFTKSHDATVPNQVLTVIRSLFAATKAGVDALVDLPLAVCISKADTVSNSILGHPLTDNTYVTDDRNRPLPLFNAEDYNEIYDKVSNFVNVNAHSLLVNMQTNYQASDFFLFSAIGTSVERYTDENQSVYYAPAAPPSPKRLTEPLLWILTKFGYINASGFVNEPNDWRCPQCNAPLHQSTTYCPDCLVNVNDQWHCAACGTDNPGGETWCAGKKCKYDRYGNQRGLLDRLFSR